MHAYCVPIHSQYYATMVYYTLDSYTFIFRLASVVSVLEGAIAILKGLLILHTVMMLSPRLSRLMEPKSLVGFAQQFPSSPWLKSSRYCSKSSSGM